MTNADQIIHAIDESKRLYAENAAAPSIEKWAAANEANNNLGDVAESHPLTRVEYETMLGGENLRDDDVIYRSQGSWWNSSDRESLIWCYAHVARRAALQNERGRYIPPTDAMLGLEMVADGLPDGFAEYHKSAE